jgi:hypothetical protein
MKNYFPFFFLIVLIFACSAKNHIPKNVLPQKKMVSILWDMFRADEFLSVYVLPADTSLNKNNETIRYYEEVFKLHQINKDEFKKSFSFYEEHPKLMKELLDTLNARGTAANLNQNKPVITDSSLKRKVNQAPLE